MSVIIRTMVVENHDQMRRGLLSLLAEIPGIEVRAVCTSGPEAVRAIEQHVIDLAIVDLKLAGTATDGIFVTRRIREESPATRILIMSATPEAYGGPRARIAGAHGYIDKNLPVPMSLTHTLTEGIRTVLDGHLYFRSFSYEDDALTERERQVLLHLSDGLGDESIADRLAISASAVRKLCSRLMVKLDFDRREQLRQYAIERRRGEERMQR